MSAVASHEHPIAPDDHRLQLPIRVAERSSSDDPGAVRNEIGQIEAGRRRELESVQRAIGRCDLRGQRRPPLAEAIRAASKACPGLIARETNFSPHVEFLRITSAVAGLPSGRR